MKNTEAPLPRLDLGAPGRALRSADPGEEVDCPKRWVELVGSAERAAVTAWTWRSADRRAYRPTAGVLAQLRAQKAKAPPAAPPSPTPASAPSPAPTGPQGEAKQTKAALPTSHVTPRWKAPEAPADDAHERRVLAWLALPEDADTRAMRRALAADASDPKGGLR